MRWPRSKTGSLSSVPSICTNKVPMAVGIPRTVLPSTHMPTSRGFCWLTMLTYSAKEHTLYTPTNYAHPPLDQLSRWNEGSFAITSWTCIFVHISTNPTVIPDDFMTDGAEIKLMPFSDSDFSKLITTAASTACFSVLSQSEVVQI